MGWKLTAETFAVKDSRQRSYLFSQIHHSDKDQPKEKPGVTPVEIPPMENMKSVKQVFPQYQAQHQGSIHKEEIELFDQVNTVNVHT